MRAAVPSSSPNASLSSTRRRLPVTFSASRRSTATEHVLRPFAFVLAHRLTLLSGAVLDTLDTSSLEVELPGCLFKSSRWLRNSRSSSSTTHASSKTNRYTGRHSTPPTKNIKCCWLSTLSWSPRSKTNTTGFPPTATSNRKPPSSASISWSSAPTSKHPLLLGGCLSYYLNDGTFAIESSSTS
ncbi:Uncharacterised protein [Corynebacterium pseudotuberculosis]|nr:Uncharacterised protein [Corynebacterium pseudotuberculosis]